MKRCSKCKNKRELFQFHKSKRSKDGYRHLCKVCQKAYYDQWRTTPENRERLAEYYRNYYKASDERTDKRAEYQKKYYTEHYEQRKNRALQRKYGITLNQYRALLNNQGNVCGVCKQPEVKNNKTKKVFDLGVDRDKDTGKVVGLICSRCRKGLSNVKRSKKFVEQLLGYIISAE